MHRAFGRGFFAPTCGRAPGVVAARGFWILRRIRRVRRLLAFLGIALFVVYCTAVGVYLFLRPWTGRAPFLGFFGSGFFRGFVSGVGLVHLAAGVADLRVLSRSLNGEAPAPPKAP